MEIREKHRVALSQLVDGAAFLQGFGNVLIEQEGNLIAHSESLMMKTNGTDGKFVIKRKSA